jgi:hypothetical protein
MAQPASVPYHKEAYILESGQHAGLTDQAAESFVAFRQTVRLPNVPWLQLRFGEYNLGKQSYITVTSLKDGHKQRLDAKGLRQWRDATAYFNGDAVDVELHVAPGEKEIFVRINELVVGERASGDQKIFQQESICQTTDDRVASNNPGAGRIVPVGCTGWIVSNGTHLTAGHCVGTNMQIMEFNVPASNSDGTINHPAPQHQYPIIATTVRFANNGIGDDWAVFDCAPNANTGLLPAQAQGAFFRMSRDSNPATVRVTGYGLDGPGPPLGNFGASPPRNADSQTQQTHAGPNLGETVSGNVTAFFSYRVDTQGGNSGSPIIVDGSALTIGIHTNAGCGAAGGSNSGTSFENDDLEIAIQAFLGTDVQYVDQGHPATIRDGTVFRPRLNVNAAINAAPSGGVVSIVTGSYSETMTITKALTLTAPVGAVIIGN